MSVSAPQPLTFEQVMEGFREIREGLADMRKTMQEESLRFKEQQEEYERQRKEKQEEYERQRKKREEEYDRQRKKKQEEYDRQIKAEQEKHDRQIKEEQAEHSRLIKEKQEIADKEVREIRRLQRETQKEIGGIGKSNGEYAEQFFIRAMKKTHSFGGITYNRVDYNWSSSRGGIDEEYDIILHNGDYVTLIEIKYKFKQDDLKTFVNRKVPHFRILFPEYADKKIYLGIAGFAFEDGVVEYAKSRGIGILLKDGKNVEYDYGTLKLF
jgi:hypothetical protein